MLKICLILRPGIQVGQWHAEFLPVFDRMVAHVLPHRVMVNLGIPETNQAQIQPTLQLRKQPEPSRRTYLLRYLFLNPAVMYPNHVFFQVFPICRKSSAYRTRNQAATANQMLQLNPSRVLHLSYGVFSIT